MSPELLDNHNFEHAISLMADPNVFHGFIHSLKPTEWYGLIQSFDLSGRTISNIDLEEVTIVLLERWSERPNQLDDWIFLHRARTALQGIFGHLFSQISDKEKADDTVRKILDRLLYFSTKVMLAEHLRNQEDSGFGIISDAVLQELENILSEEIINESHDFLASEPDLFRVLRYAKGRAAGRPYHTDTSVNELTVSVLLSALREKNEPMFLERQTRLVVDVHPQLDCDGLIRLYGNSQHLRQRIVDLKAVLENLIPSIERRIPLYDFKIVLGLAEDCLNGDPLEMNRKSK